MFSSLKARLIFYLYVLVSIALTVMGILSFLSAKHEIDEIYDAHMVHLGKTLYAITAHEIEEHESDELSLKEVTNYLKEEFNGKFDHDYETKVVFRIWDKEKLVAFSEGGNHLGNRHHIHGFSNKMINEEEWIFYTLFDKGAKVTIEVAKKVAVRQELVHYIAFSIFNPLVFILPFIFLIVYLAISRGLIPLYHLSKAIEHRHSSDLRPIHLDDIPDEVQPLLDSINHLMKRLETSFEQEKKFTDHAAHELKTPLSVLKTQTQVLLKTNDENTRKELLVELVSGVDRVTRMVEQLLAFARLQNVLQAFKPVNFSLLITALIKEFEFQLHKKSITLHQNIQPGIELQAYDFALELMVKNLLDNAIKYVSVGDEITIELIKENDQVIFIVVDTGPGIVEEEQQKIFDRFYRIPGAAAYGSGLGLSMVQWIADLHQAKIEVGFSDKKNAQGAKFEVFFSK